MAISVLHVWLAVLILQIIERLIAYHWPTSLPGKLAIFVN